ncbi:hypothetical protein J2X69_001615 [Algoriphagus sp. 4150]|nr:hypothetical protein [Algoriphagus sp. 4150]
MPKPLLKRRGFFYGIESRGEVYPDEAQRISGTPARGTKAR